MDLLRNNKQNQATALVVLAVLGGAAYLFYMKSDHSGRQGYPCYCKKCEHDLVDGANAGDAQAQALLRQLTIFQNEQQKSSTLRIFVVVALVALGVFLYQKYGVQESALQARLAAGLRR